MPAVVTVYDKNEISLGLFKSCGFEVYQKKGQVFYMTRGGIVDGVKIKANDVARIKKLLGINPTNIWNSAKGEWRLEKQKWNELIENAGMIGGVSNPSYASREGCWQKGQIISKCEYSKVCEFPLPLRHLRQRIPQIPQYHPSKSSSWNQLRNQETNHNDL